MDIKNSDEMCKPREELENMFVDLWRWQGEMWLTRTYQENNFVFCLDEGRVNGWVYLV